MSEIVNPEDTGLFNSPVPTDLINELVAKHQANLCNIKKLAEAFAEPNVIGMLHYFINGNDKENGYRYPNMGVLFSSKGAISALNAESWSAALSLTDVLDVMPQARRDEWHSLIREMKTPDFTNETVRATLGDLLASRGKFFAERIDGIFRALSREHLTNRPEGFGKRMILSNVTLEYSLSRTQQGYINDLRCIVAKFMGRPEPKRDATFQAVRAAKRNTGEWMQLDGGALKLRVYQKGTGHLEVHPEIAWRLNAVLASLYPTAIPEHYRKPQKEKNKKEIELLHDILPPSVVDELATLKPGIRLQERTTNYHLGRYESISVRNSVELVSKRREIDKHLWQAIDNVLTSLGGSYDFEQMIWRFDYDIQPVIDKVVCSGTVPNQRSHQFYPTPEAVAMKAIELAEITDDMICLEPSAGNGDLLRFMPANSHAVEISELRCEVLRSRFPKAEVMQGDFVDVDYFRLHESGRKYDRIVMNPPFDRGQWGVHLRVAYDLLKPNSRLVAVLPLSAKNKLDFFEDAEKVEWSEPFHNAFDKTSISVVIVTIFN